MMVRSQKIKYIYTITCLYDIPSYYLPKKKCLLLTPEEKVQRNLRRCFGWFSNLKQAKEVVENNHTDLHEYSYLYAVIERNREGIGCDISQEWWYKWEGSHERGKYVSIEKPKELKNIIGWGIG